MTRILCRSFSLGLPLLSLLLAAASSAQADYHLVRSYAMQDDTTPTSVAVSDNVYVTVGGQDDLKRGVQVYSKTTGDFLGKLGEGQMEAPSAIAADPSGHVYVMDNFGQSVFQFPGSPLNIDSAYLQGFPSLSFGPYGLWIADWSGHVSLYGPDSTEYLRIDIPDMDPALEYPSGLAVDSNSGIYVAVSGYDFNDQRILQVDFDGTLINQFGAYGSGDGEFGLSLLDSLAVDSQSRIYVADEANHRVEIFDGPTGQFLEQFPTADSYGIAVDPLGENVWVVDNVNHQLQQFSNVPEPAGIVLLATAAVCLVLARGVRLRSRTR